jgi:hypothetical protein
LILLVFGVAAVVAALVWPREREPVYQGKTLGEWIDSADFRFLGKPKSNPQAEAAIRHIGTNALPYLMEWIECGDPGKRNKIESALARLIPGVARVLDARRFRKSVRASQTVWAFRVLGSQASPAIPELVKLAGSTNMGISFHASYALRGIGKDAVPGLLGLTQASNGLTRFMATNALEEIAPAVLGKSGTQ